MNDPTSFPVIIYHLFVNYFNSDVFEICLSGLNLCPFPKGKVVRAPLLKSHLEKKNV